MFGDGQRFEQWPLGNTQVGSAKIDWLGALVTTVRCENFVAKGATSWKLKFAQKWQQTTLKCQGAVVSRTTL